jgi:hypothetical protein
MRLFEVMNCMTNFAKWCTILNFSKVVIVYVSYFDFMESILHLS